MKNFQKKFFYFFVCLISLLYISANFTPAQAGTLTCSDSLTGKIMLSEFSSASTTEWVELLGGDQNNSINLSGCSIVFTPTGGGSTSTKNLSGTLPRSGFLTFDLDTNSMNNAGGKIDIKDSSNNTIKTVTYGTYLPQAPGDHVSTAPNSSQTGWYNPDGNSWNTGTPSKGWCNPEGFGECPTISTITNSMSGDGVTTNLGSIEDFTHASGLYFEKTGTGRIAFSNEINFTDRDALSWMQTLDQKISMTSGYISLDADLITNLVNTQASLTMYGLTYTNPRILVDGADDTGGVVSNLSYNSSAGTLTFTAAHFTTFQATENTSSTSSLNSSGNPPGCSSEKPQNSPNLFRIDTTKNSATLYFVPASGSVSYYLIAYGYSNNDERFSTSFNQGKSTGVISYTINSLSPNTTYFFKVRAGNGCATGNWSKYLSAKTEGYYNNSTVSEPIQNAIPKPSPTETISQNVSNENSVKAETNKLQTEQNEGKAAEKLLNQPSLLERIIGFFRNIFRLR